MNGAEVLLQSSEKLGIEICFANAGTTELPIVLAMDGESRIKAVLGLFEGVCTGAADGYGRMAGKPAMTLLHLGPGLGNGIANLHNARRARTPVFNVIGEHASWHLAANPPLAMDIEKLSGTVSQWVRTNKDPKHLSEDVSDGISACSSGQVATLIVPHDHQLAACETIFSGAVKNISAPVDEKAVHASAKALKKGGKTAMILGARALSIQGMKIAGNIQKITGCDLLTETFPCKIERAPHLPPIIRIPYFPEPAIELLSAYETVILAGAAEPVSFFGYPGFRSRLLSDNQKQFAIHGNNQDLLVCMELLFDMIKTRGKNTFNQKVKKSIRPDLPQGALNPFKICQTLAVLQPENAIIIEEGLTTSTDYYTLSNSLPAHTILPITGGAIGYGPPSAVGAALACPDRPVIDFQADGSAMYTVQSLWTQARENLNITTLICSNRSYKILQTELLRDGMNTPGKKTKALMALTSPNIDWVKISEGLGVPAIAVSRSKELAKALKRGISKPGPFLIEMIF